MSKVRVTIDLDYATGDYEVQYNNVSEPGVPLDFTKTMALVKRIVGVHAPAVEGEADSPVPLGAIIQAKRDKGEMQ